MSEKLAWWLSFAGSRAACVVEAPAYEGVLGAVAVAHVRGCAGNGEVRATFLATGAMKRDIPRRLWYRLRTAEEWRSCGVDAAVDAVPPGMDPCPLCLAETDPASKEIH